VTASRAEPLPRQRYLQLIGLDAKNELVWVVRARVGVNNLPQNNAGFQTHPGTQSDRATNNTNSPHLSSGVHRREQSHLGGSDSISGAQAMRSGLLQTPFRACGVDFLKGACCSSGNDVSPWPS